MLPNKPYLLRAFHQWILDSGCTPIIVLDTTHPQCKVPKQAVSDNEILFNVSPVAVRQFNITNNIVEFQASFDGVIHFISAPMNAILAIYAEENDEGIFFDPEEERGGASGEFAAVAGKVSLIEADSLEESDAKEQSSPKKPAKKGKPDLRVVE